MEIDSPPFPKDSTSPEQLFWTLSALFDWTLNQEAWANMEASGLVRPM